LSVVAWVNGEPRHGAGACGALAWQVKQVVPPRTIRKSAPWQIWQEANPELPGAFLAVAPCTAGELQFGIGPWWQPAVLPKQETLEMPPVRSEPWHSVQELLPPLAM
jgi:hypothetical protein